MKIKLEDVKEDADYWYCRRCGNRNKKKENSCTCGANIQGYYTDENRIVELKEFIDRLILSIES